MKKAACFLFIALFYATSVRPADAQTNELRQIEEQLKDQAAEEKRLKEEAAEREREVAALRHRLIETAHSLQDAETEISALETAIAGLETEKSAIEDELRAESDSLSDVLAALQSLELSKPPALLVSPEDANKAARAAMLLSDAAPTLEARASELRMSLERLAELEETLTAKQVAFEATNTELTARRDVLEELMAQKEKERDVATSLAAAAQRETARLAARTTSLREVVRRLERLAHAVTPRLKPARKRFEAPQSNTRNLSLPTVKPQAARPFSTARRFADARGALRAPVAGRVVGEFGKPRPEGGAYEGMRFAVRDQGIVIAPFEGRVVFARNWGLIGNMIVLDVGGGYHLLLMGVGDIRIGEGQRVAAGEPVANMADGGANLDLEIRKNGEPVNPALWLSRKTMDEPVQ